MSRGPATFRQRDVTAAIKAVIAAGVPVSRVEVDRNKIVVVAGAPEDPVGRGETAKNEWDDLLP